MRAIGLVLLSIAIMALLLTDADAKRRSSARGSQAAPTQSVSGHAIRDRLHLVRSEALELRRVRRR